LDTSSSMSLLGLAGVVGTSFLSAWATFRYIVLGSYRLSEDTSKRLIDKINQDASWTWVINGEHVDAPKFPVVFEALVFLKGIPFYFARGERLLTAGWKGKEEMSSMTFLRWHKKKIDALIKNEFGNDMISISALSVGSSDRLGELCPDPNAEAFLNAGSFEDIEEDVRLVSSGEIRKTGFLLHGAPGSGKTQFVKYLSKKYSMPIYVVYLRPDYDNYDIARMFSEIPRRCIVLLEDFDNYFDGRECTMKNEQVRFTFDSVINALDGVHNDYRGVVFAMTTNDISKIDDSLKKRPSRFKFVREFGLPDFELRRRILGCDERAKVTEGLSLDEVFSQKQQNEKRQS